MILANYGIVSSSGGSVPLLLDTYSGATGAYSLRKIKSTYTGYAIRVRRSSDNTSQDIGFNGLGDLDTTTLLSFVGANNGFVSIWYDQSGYGYDIIQSTAINQPQIVLNGSILSLNSKPSIWFTYSDLGRPGTSTVLSNTNAYTVSGLQNISVITACRVNNFASPGGIMHYGPDNNWGLVNLSISNSQLHNRFGTGQSNNNNYYNSTFGDTNLIISAYHYSTNETLRINGSDVLNVSGKLSTIANTGNQFYMGYSPISGSNIYFRGNISEMIVYSNNQYSNRDLIETNINNFYSIY